MLYGDWRTWLSAGVGGGCVWKQYVTSFGTALPLSGIRWRPCGAHSVNGGRQGELLTLVKRTVMFISAASFISVSGGSGGRSPSIIVYVRRLSS